MKRLVMPLSLIVVLVAACAPAAARPTYLYQDNRQSIIEAVVGLAPTIKPPDGYNYFGADRIGDTFVSLVATPTTGAAVLGVLVGGYVGNLRVTVTTMKSNLKGTTRVAFSGVPSGGDVNSYIDHLIAALNGTLESVQPPKVAGG